MPCIFPGGSSTASTKSATIEMYVGSSTGYNDTMSGETMSSISEKSGSYISGMYLKGGPYNKVWVKNGTQKWSF